MRRPWIKIETATPDKPEICAIATQLRMDADMVVGKLIRLWSWIAVNKVSGSDLGVTKEFLDKLAGRKGFADALQSAGWLLVSDGKLSLPYFERHNSDAAKVRALTAQRVKRHRITKEFEAKNSDNAVTLNRGVEVPSQEEGVKTTTIEEEEDASDGSLIEARADEVIGVDLESTGGEMLQVPDNDEVSGAEEEQVGEALSINAEPTFRPLDFEDAPPHDNEVVALVVEPEVPEVEVEAPAPEPTAAKKSKRKADGKQDDQPLLF